MPISRIVRSLPSRPARPHPTLLRFAAALAAALVPAGAAARGQPLPLVHPAATPHEDYSRRMLVGSDRIVVGIERMGGPRDLPMDRLAVYLPGATRDSLCVSIRSIDGKYRGTFQFAVPAGTGRAALLDVSSRRYPRELAAYTPDRLAVAAWLAPSCAAPPDNFVAVGRSSAVAGGTLRLSLNADAGLLIRAGFVSSGHGPPSIRCPLLEVDDAHAYNRVCIIPLPASAGRYELQLALRIPGQEPQYAQYAVHVP